MKIEFLDILNTSISAGWMILAVIALRFMLKKAPKAIHCVLWALVAVRLICPVSIESQFSLIPSAQTVPEYYQTQDAAISTEQTVLDIVENPVYPQDVDVTLALPASRTEWHLFEWNFIWFLGMASMAGYALFSYFRLRKQVSASIAMGKGLWLCDYIDSPFILGILRPRIYLPSELDPVAADHVLAHERAHLARRDHWWKPLGFMLLAIHWFNPLMWIAYILLCRDIELACDEKVIRHLGTAEKKSYSAALLRCSVSRPMIAACPLAFGEVGVKQRVKSVLHYQQPAFWIVLIALLLGVVTAVCFLTDPLTADVYDVLYQNGYTVLAQCCETVTLTIPRDALPDTVFSEDGHEFREKQIIVYENDTTAIWLRSVQFANEGQGQMYFEFDVSYDLPKVGTILHRSRVQVGTNISTGVAQPVSWNLADTVTIRAYGPGCRFTFYVDTEAVRQAEHEISIDVRLQQVTYARNGAEPKLNKAASHKESDQNKSFHASGDTAYDLGRTGKQQLVFLEPYRAFEAMTRDYADAIHAIRTAFDLAPLTPLEYADYKTYGAQIDTGNRELLEKCHAVAQFLDFYENSFIDEAPADVTPTADSLAPGLYKSADKLYWAAYSSYYLETMEMEVGENTIQVWDNAPVEVEWKWQDECPIRDPLRRILADLYDLDARFAFNKDLDCRYMVIDTSHFLVDHESGLYLVSWRHSTKSIEILNYVFRMVPEAEWNPPLQGVWYDDPVLDAIQAMNRIYTSVPSVTFVAYEPITQAVADGPEGAVNDHYGAARVMTAYPNEDGWTLACSEIFGVVMRLDDDGNVLAYYQTGTLSWDDRFETRFNVPITSSEAPTGYAEVLDENLFSQLEAYGIPLPQ